MLGASVTNYIYDSAGSAVGFWRGRYIYALDGSPIRPAQWHARSQVSSVTSQPLWLV